MIYTDLFCVVHHSTNHVYKWSNASFWSIPPIHLIQFSFKKKMSNRSIDRSICVVRVKLSHCYHHYPFSKSKSDWKWQSIQTFHSLFLLFSRQFFLTRLCFFSFFFKHKHAYKGYVKNKKNRSSKYATCSTRSMKNLTPIHI